MRYEFSFDEILSEHAYDRPLIVDGVRCHGGFVAGRYTSPRTRVRPDAIAPRAKTERPQRLGDLREFADRRLARSPGSGERRRFSGTRIPSSSSSISRVTVASTSRGFFARAITIAPSQIAPKSR